jgi:hypothetical protein
LNQVKPQACNIFPQLLGDRPGILVKKQGLADPGNSTSNPQVTHG